MKITVLGNNGPYPSAGGACSGYLLEEDNTKVLLDCGSGVLSNLQKLCAFEDLDAIILSHLHSDHASDMFVLRYAIQIKQKKGMMNKPIPVYLPHSPCDEYQRFDIDGIFKLTSIDSNLKVEIGSLQFSFCEMKHPVMAYATSVVKGNKKFIYSGDTSWNDNITSFCGMSDLIMLDSGLLAKDKTEAAPHLTAYECGLIAEESRCKKLLLTHFWPGYNTEELLAEASLVFSNTEATEIMKSYIV